MRGGTRYTEEKTLQGSLRLIRIGLPRLLQCRSCQPPLISHGPLGRDIMQINTMISQLSGGMLVSTEIFVVTLSIAFGPRQLPPREAYLQKEDSL